MKMKTIAALAAVVAALTVASGAKAQSQASAGACLAFVNNLGVPILVQVLSTNGSSPNAMMTGMQTHEAGYQDYPWIIQPGGPKVLVLQSYGSENYLASQNGNFNVGVMPIKPPADQRVAVQIYSWPMPKLTWVFHPEMTENGNCKGAWVDSVGK